MENDLLSFSLRPEAIERERREEVDLRPFSLDSFIGQKNIIENLKVMIGSAKKRKAPLDHLLFSGPPGLGKTSLSLLIAKEMKGKLYTLSGPALDKKADLAAILTTLNFGDVLFIDEIHRLPIPIEEILYSAMEDFRLDVVMGSGPGAKAISLPLAPFTLVGATTKSGLLSTPLRDRFLGHFHFELYNLENLHKIIEENAPKIGVNISSVAIKNLALCARGTPRLANRLLRRARDLAIVESLEEITQESLFKVFDLMGIFPEMGGLDRLDLRILKALGDVFSHRAVGLESLSAFLGEEKTTLEDIYEPHLIQQGLLMRTPRGRVITPRGLEMLDLYAQKAFDHEKNKKD